MNGIESLLKIEQKKSRKIIGMMSGTSADGVDLVLASIDGCGKNTKCEILMTGEYEYPAALRKKILDAMKPDALMREVCSLDFELGEFFAERVNDFTSSRKIDEIDCISSHGQTVYHNPNGYHPCTLQIGDGDIIASRTGIITLSDFRVKDIAAGGEGAPLVPYVDYILYANGLESIALNNLGGISNVTYIPKDASEDKIVAFDTGPANALIDLAALKYFNLPFDRNGEISAKGKIDQKLFEMLKEKEMPYIQRVPPKSTGKEVYNIDYIPDAKVDPVNLMRTLVEFTAWSIWESYKIHIIPCGLDRVVLTGGGAMNRALVKSLRNYFEKIRVDIAQDWRWREAKAFAILGNELLCGNSANNPKATGAKRLTMLGKISLP